MGMPIDRFLLSSPMSGDTVVTAVTLGHGGRRVPSSLRPARRGRGARRAPAEGPEPPISRIAPPSPLPWREYSHSAKYLNNFPSRWSTRRGVVDGTW